MTNGWHGMDRAVALADNDVAQIGWVYSAKIEECLGFAVRRVTVNSPAGAAPSPDVFLPAWVGFKGGSNSKWQPHTTDEWPIQKFNWRDLTAVRGGTYKYEVIPMVGKPGALKPLDDRKLTTNEVTLTPNLGKISAYFNRGILSTQHLAHTLDTGPSGVPNYKELIDRIDQPGDPLRGELAGQIIEGMLSLLHRAKEEGGECYAALYELSDPELLQALLDTKSNPGLLHLILSNTGADDEENDAARQALHEAGLDITDRMLGSGHIGHNKFMVYVDPSGQPQAVLSGSTNWTATATCGQSNNAIVIQSSPLAEAYVDYWKRLKSDDSEQALAFREENQTSHAASDVNATVWFSPNTRQKSKPSKNPATPVDLDEVFRCMGAAKQAILFLAFQPGSPSIVQTAAECLDKNPDLFVRGAATDPSVHKDFLDTVELYHGSAEPDLVVPATAVTDQFSYWEKELLKSSPNAHAIIHDKIVVIDPFSDDCVLITGSHNLGFRASYNNDENLLIIRGNRPVAEAYAVHVMDVYDHYRWRFTLHDSGTTKAWWGLATTDAWQDKYFRNGVADAPELHFWLERQPSANGGPSERKTPSPKKSPSSRVRKQLRRKR
jgi:phosphatidylserine/phosphatidylglycerophosphate/cardiolipin synthase-like enzyme